MGAFDSGGTFRDRLFLRHLFVGNRSCAYFQSGNQKNKLARVAKVGAIKNNVARVANVRVCEKVLRVSIVYEEASIKKDLV